jgi:DNA-binding protein HU-beta
LNRTELVGEVSKQTGLTTKQAESAVKGFEYVITSTLRRGETVRITGFGTFKVRDRAARRGRNPQTGAPVRIKASKGVGFAAGAGLKKDLNSRSALEKPEYVGTVVAKAPKAAPARKAAPAKKAVAKKVVAKKVPAKKVVAKKAPAKKVVAKKAPAKKSGR